MENEISDVMKAHYSKLIDFNLKGYKKKIKIYAK